MNELPLKWSSHTVLFLERGARDGSGLGDLGPRFKNVRVKNLALYLSCDQGKRRKLTLLELSAHFLQRSLSLYGKWKKCFPGELTVLLEHSRNVQRQPPIFFVFA